MLRKIILKYSWHYARFFYGKCDRVLAPSATIRTVLEKNKIGNVGVVPNSVDLERFNTSIDGSRVKASMKLKRGEKIVFYAGRLSREKRLETMIKAARLMKKENVRFVVAGTGPAANTTKAW